MKIKIKLINEVESFEIQINDGRTFRDIFEELNNTLEGPFIMLGKIIKQKSTIESIEEV